jgi:hypothetical protein
MPEAGEVKRPLRNRIARERKIGHACGPGVKIPAQANLYSSLSSLTQKEV